MEEAWRDEANRLARSPDDDDIDDDFFDPNRPQPAWLTHLGNECDCKKWLYIEHPQVREDTITRLYERSGPGTESHNTLVVAIFAFCIQNQILSRPELAEFRRKLENSDAGLDQWTWDWLRKLIQYPYAGRRLKSNKQGYEPNHVRESKDKYEAFLKDAQEQFHLFFEDGEKKLRKVSASVFLLHYIFVEHLRVRQSWSDLHMRKMQRKVPDSIWNPLQKSRSNGR